MAAGLDGAAFTVALDLALELRDELVDRGFHVRRRLARAQGRPLGEDGRLGHLARRDRRVPLLGELDLDLCLLGELLAELGELSLGVLADRRRDLDVLPLHLKPHETPPWWWSSRTLRVTQRSADPRFSARRGSKFDRIRANVRACECSGVCSSCSRAPPSRARTSMLASPDKARPPARSTSGSRTPRISTR